MIDTVKKLVDQRRKVHFYLTPESIDKGKYTAEVEFNDEDFYVFADNFGELFSKLERKEFMGLDISIDEAGEDTRIEIRKVKNEGLK